MTVEAIRLRNFMAFEDTGWIELRPITLLFGRNSSGKSAIIRALRLLKQSLDSPGGKRPFVFESRYGVDLGAFKDMAHGGSVEQHVWFCFRCRDAAIRDRLDKYIAKSKRNDLQPSDMLEIALGYEAHRSDDGNPDGEYVELFDLQIWQIGENANERSLLLQTTLWEPRDRPHHDEYWLVEGVLTRGRDAKSWQNFGYLLPSRGFLPELVQSKQNSSSRNCLSELMLILRNEITSFLNDIIHLGPIRPEPRRRYSFDSDSAFDWRQRGWGAFLSFIRGEVSDIQGEINHWVHNLELGDKAESHPISLPGALFTEHEIGITEEGWMKPLPLSFHGFGLSQALPVIVQSLMAPTQSTIIIEQPELHLHPFAQARLGDLFIAAFQREAWRTWREEVIQAREFHTESPDPPRHKEILAAAPRFILETHSEHLLLRLRRRIAETSTILASRASSSDGAGAHPQTDRFFSDDICMYFVSRSKNAISQIALIGIDESGELDLCEAPPLFDDFFADDLIEIGALARAMVGGEA